MPEKVRPVNPDLQARFKDTVASLLRVFSGSQEPGKAAAVNLGPETMGRDGITRLPIDAISAKRAGGTVRVIIIATYLSYRKNSFRIHDFMI